MKDRHDFSSDEGVPTCAGSAGATACPKRVFGWCGRGPKQDTSCCPKFGWSNMFNAENMTNRQGSDNMKTSSIQYIQYQYPHIREKHQKAQLYPTPIFNSHSTHNVTRLCLQFWCWSYSCSCWLRCIRHRHRGCCRCRCWWRWWRWWRCLCRWWCWCRRCRLARGKESAGLLHHHLGTSFLSNMK